VGTMTENPPFGEFLVRAVAQPGGECGRTLAHRLRLGAGLPEGWVFGHRSNAKRYPSALTRGLSNSASFTSPPVFEADSVTETEKQGLKARSMSVTMGS